MGNGIANATQVGWGSQTPAIQTTARAGMGGRTAVRRRRAKSGTKTARKAKRVTRKRRRTSTKARLVKGSAAAKRYMAKIRRMRKR